MSGNTFGKLFTVTTAGESHGPALVAIVDGCPPGLELSLEDLQRASREWLFRHGIDSFGDADDGRRN